LSTRVERVTNRESQQTRTVDHTSDHHHVEQGVDRLDAVLRGGPGVALGDVLGDLVVRLVKLALLILERRVRVKRARNAKVRLLEVLREQAGGLQVLPGALEPLLVELRGGRARPPGGDILLYDAPDFVGAAEARLRARENPVIGLDKRGGHLRDTRAGR
jgi:hypothetical protein